jgi:hypothetical protein
MATLRDDGRPAALEGAPVLTAAAEEPIRTASLDMPRARDLDMTAYAADESARSGQESETEVSSTTVADDDVVSSTRPAETEEPAPLPPIRPANFGASRASAKTAIKQAFN